MQGTKLPSGTQFVPMIYAASDATTANLNTAKASGSGIVLGFNEPDNVNQADDTVDVSSKNPGIVAGPALSPDCFQHCQAKGSAIMLGLCSQEYESDTQYRKKEHWGLFASAGKACCLLVAFLRTGTVTSSVAQHEGSMAHLPYRRESSM